MVFVLYIQLCLKMPKIAEEKLPVFHSREKFGFAPLNFYILDLVHLGH